MCSSLLNNSSVASFATTVCAGLYCLLALLALLACLLACVACLLALLALLACLLACIACVACLIACVACLLACLYLHFACLYCLRALLPCIASLQDRCCGCWCPPSVLAVLFTPAELFLLEAVETEPASSQIGSDGKSPTAYTCTTGD